MLDSPKILTCSPEASEDFFERFYLFIHERHTHTEAETQALPLGSLSRTQSQDPGITLQAKGRCSTTEPPGHPQ